MSTIESEMKIAAINPWFGSKRRLAPTIIQELGKHRAYWEPFCGSMAVLLAKPEASAETVNDLHGDLINLARVIAHRSAGPELYRRLRRTWMHKDIFEASAEEFRARGHSPAPSEPDVERAYGFFICSWLGRNGVQGTQSYNQGYCVRYTKNGGHGSTRFNSCIDSIPAWRRRLRRVTILNQDAFDLLARIEDAPGVSLYADPPYLVKGAKYVHDFNDGFMSQMNDHERLADALSRFKKTRVVVSYYDHPSLAALYAGWTRREVFLSKALSNPSARDEEVDSVAPEVLILNGPSYAKA